VRNHRDEKCPIADVAIAEAVPFRRERPEVRDAEREECDDGRERDDRLEMRSCWSRNGR